MSLTPEETSAELSAGTLLVLARMRESPALELQQRLLSDLGRVGQVAPMPATFSVGVAVHYLDVAGRPALLPTPTLDADGGICWVGRDDIGSQKLRLSLGEDACDQVCAALQAVDPDQLYPDVRALVASLLSSGELLTLLAAGVELPLETDTSRRPLQLATAANTADGGTKSSTPQPKVVGIITRNLQPNVVLKPKEAATTAILIVVGDLIQDGATPAETF
jgi:hypothetical protein